MLKVVVKVEPATKWEKFWDKLGFCKFEVYITDFIQSEYEGISFIDMHYNRLSIKWCDVIDISIN